jgi:hypothetical protein
MQHTLKHALEDSTYARIAAIARTGEITREVIEVLSLATEFLDNAIECIQRLRDEAPDGSTRKLEMIRKFDEVRRLRTTLEWVWCDLELTLLSVMGFLALLSPAGDQCTCTPDPPNPGRGGRGRGAGTPARIGGMSRARLS